MPKTNPNKVNQWTGADPREKLMWDLYVNPRSKTFGNALRSAIAAGYTDETGRQITKTLWFTERLRRHNLKNKAEEVLKETLEMPVQIEKAISEDVQVVKTDSGLVRCKVDVAKFISERLNKEHYSQRQEITGPEGRELMNQDEVLKKLEELKEKL